MATAKLWWDGSAWVTTQTTWVHHNSRSSSNYTGIVGDIYIAAHDDGTIKLNASWHIDGGGYFTNSSYRQIATTNGTVLINLTDGNRNQTVDVTSYNYFSTYGNAGSWKNIDMKQVYGGNWQNNAGTKTTTTTNPFVTVTYNANGGSGGPSTQPVCKGVSCSLSSTVPTRANHTFLGWAESDSARTATYVAGGDITALEDTTLYAVWGPAVFIDVDEGTTISLNSVSYTNETAVVQNLVWGNSYPITTTANTGYIVKEQSHPDGTLTIEADETDVSATGQRVGCHLDDGNDWVQAVMYYDDGEEWHMVQAYYDNGNSWELVY